MNESNWVDFRSVKAAVSMEMVLGHYHIDWLRKRGDELRGRCPIHKGEGTDTFHVSLSKNAFHCFSCKKRGNVLDFVAAMEDTSVKEAAEKLASWFSVTQASEAPTPKGTTSDAGSATQPKPTELINKPLGFQLRGVDTNHPYLVERGISSETAQRFGVGFFPGKGSMAGRVVIPIHNELGELLAYAGRALDGSEPKYRLPAGFHKSAVLYNLHRAIQNNDQKTVVVVEGFFDCMKLEQAGFHAVALMGSSLSQTQEELLAAHFRMAWLLFDGDEAGRNACRECAERLLPRMFIRVSELPSGKQPDQMEPGELRTLLKQLE